MIRIGITGSIATGKSTVLSIFENLGYPVYSADQAVHDLYAGAAAPKIEALFPNTVHNGVVDRRLLANVLAQNPEGFEKLEAIVHPMVREKFFEFLARTEQQNKSLVVVEIPLLFETGAPYPIDKIVVTYCDPEIQRARALARTGMTAEKFDMILMRQLSQDEKRAKADFTIDTSVSLAHTQSQITSLLQSLNLR